MAKLSKAYLCLDCDEIHENWMSCPVCGSKALAPLTKWILPRTFCEKCHTVHGTGVLQCEKELTIPEVAELPIGPDFILGG